MARHKEVQHIEAYDREYIAKVTCDLCKAEINRDRYGEVDEVRMFRRIGAAYNCETFGVFEVYDVCPTCWITKVMPWMIRQGAGLPYRIDADEVLFKEP